MKIKEIIVVEGKNDAHVLQSYFNCDTIITHGTHLGKQTLETIKKAQNKRGIIIFTDPDSPGNMIRNKINQTVPGCKNAFIEKNKAKTTKKVGVEHASKEDLEKSLSHLMTYCDDLQDTISWQQFMELGLTGKENSAYLRERLGNRCFIGKANAKTLFKRLNMLQIDYETCLKMIEEEL